MIRSSKLEHLGYKLVVLLASLGSACAMFAPGDTTKLGAAWHGMRVLLRGDTGVGTAFLIVSICIIVSIVSKSQAVRASALTVSTLWWTTLAVSFFISSAIAIGPWIAGGIALASGIALVLNNIME